MRLARSGPCAAWRWSRWNDAMRWRRSLSLRSGNDASDGSSSSPWRTLQHAADVVNAGDTVIVRAGNYAGFYLTSDGTAASRIVFQAEAGVTINQRNAITPDGINLEGADYVTVEGFNVVGMPRTGIRSVLNHDVIIRNNRLDKNGKWGILTGFSDDLLIESNVATRSQVEHGIYVSNSGDRPIIRNNVIWGNRANGIHMNGDVSLGGDGIISGALVEGNVIYDNGVGGGSGINCDGVQNSIDSQQPDLQHARQRHLAVSHRRRRRLVGQSGREQHGARRRRWPLGPEHSKRQHGQHGSQQHSVSPAHSFRGSIDISADSLAGFSSDYNVVMNRFTTNGGDSVQTLAQWQAATGQDVHSLVATPSQLFVNPAGFDFHLLASGPAVDAGTSQFAPRGRF